MYVAGTNVAIYIYIYIYTHIHIHIYLLFVLQYRVLNHLKGKSDIR